MKISKEEIPNMYIKVSASKKNRHKYMSFPKASEVQFLKTRENEFFSDTLLQHTFLSFQETREIEYYISTIHQLMKFNF